MAAHENVKPPSMTRTVAALEDAGLVTRPPERHRRPPGRRRAHRRWPIRVMDEDRARRTAWLAQRLGELSAADVELLRRVAPLLERLAGS